MEQAHDFRRDRSCRNCSLCLDDWPSGDSVISKFNVCSGCGLGVHSSCTEIAKQFYPCDRSAVSQIVSKHRDNPPDVEGSSSF
jgi:hypothetical protein